MEPLATQQNLQPELEEPFNYDFVSTTARIACYDDLKSAPRITEIQPNSTAEYIENLASKIYEQAKLAGGSISYTVIREVSENFIHAKFSEIIVSILDNGNTIRFADQGPGIAQKEKAQMPGFSSAIEPMKHYIRGVGSGLPIVKDYLDSSNGSITIEDNLVCGSVVTISLNQNEEKKEARKVSTASQRKMPIPYLNERERLFLKLLSSEGPLGITELHELTNTSASTVHNTLKKLQEEGLVYSNTQKKRDLTPLGLEIIDSLQS